MTSLATDPITANRFPNFERRVYNIRYESIGSSTYTLCHAAGEILACEMKALTDGFNPNND